MSDNTEYCNETVHNAADDPPFRVTFFQTPERIKHVHRNTPRFGMPKDIHRLLLGNFEREGSERLCGRCREQFHCHCGHCDRMVHDFAGSEMSGPGSGGTVFGEIASTKQQQIQPKEIRGHQNDGTTLCSSIAFFQQTTTARRRAKMKTTIQEEE